MHNAVATILCVLGSYVLFKFINRINASHHHARRAEELGCKPAPLRKNKWPLGLDQLWDMMQADNRNEVPTEVLKILRKAIYPTIEMRVMGDVSIMTTDPRNVQAILATQFEDFDLGVRRNKYFFPLLGDGIFTADGELWSHSRALLRPQFAREQISNLDLLENHVQLMFKHLQIQPNGWTSKVELSAMFFRLTIDSATEFLFGQSACTQIFALPLVSNNKIAIPKDTYKDLDRVTQAFNGATHAMGIRARLGGLHFLYNPKIFQDSCKTVHKFADYYVNLALSNHHQEPAEPASQSPTKYVFLNELVKVTQDPIELRSQLLNILLAGRDTTAGLLGWTFYLLARHPAIYTKLRTSILQAFGPYSATDTSNITFSSLKGCAYLQHILHETLRLYPSVPLNNRAANKNTTLPHGGGPDGKSPVYVRKGQQVAYSVHVMHRSRDLWGEDAEVFRPERWEGGREKGGWKFLPFNGGPRVCLGQQYALTEAGYVVTRMVQRFGLLENLDGDGEVKFQYTVTSAPLSVRVRFYGGREEI